MKKRFFISFLLLIINISLLAGLNYVDRLSNDDQVKNQRIEEQIEEKKEKVETLEKSIERVEKENELFRLEFSRITNKE